MIKKLINNKILNGRPTRSVGKAALIIAVAGVVSRLLGLFRDRILASQFGAGDVLDVYYAAFRVPDLLYSLLVLGALSAAFVPVITEIFAKKEEEKGWQLANDLMNLIIFFVACAAILLVIAAPWFVKLIAPGFTGEKLEQTVLFTRIMFLSPLFLGISAVFSGILMSFKNFLIYSMAPIMYNIGIIVGAVFFVDKIGPSGLAWGVVLGAILHMAVQYPATRSLGFRGRWNLRQSFGNPYIWKIIRLMIPRTLGIAMNQINFLIITIFASVLASGSLAVFNFANNLQSVPLGLFAISFAVAVFPTLSSLAAEKKWEVFSEVLTKTIRRVMFFVIPLSVFIIVLRAQLVRVVLGAGEFDWEDTLMTLQVLGVLSASLFAQSLIPVLARAYYAFQNTRTPFYIALASEVVNVSLIWILIGRFQIVGLAVAFSVTSIVNAALLYIVFRHKYGKLKERKLASSILKITAASFLAGVAAQGTKHLFPVIGPDTIDTFMAIFGQLVAAGGVALASYFLIVAYLKEEEFYSFKRLVFARLIGKTAPVVEDRSLHSDNKA